MITKSQKIRLGIFIVFALGILVLAVLALSVNRFFEEKDIYHIAYQDVSVSGLEPGSSVKYLGIRVGTIRDIKIDPNDVTRVIVTVALDAGTPIKEDVKAEIATIGITGLKLIELRGGSNEAKLLKPGKYIQAGKSVTEDITGKAEIIAEKIELTLNNLIELTSGENQKKIFDLVDNTTATVDQVNKMLKQNRASMNRTMTNLDTMMQDLVYAGRSTRETTETIASIVESDTFKATIENISGISRKLREADIYNLIKELNTTVVTLNKMLMQTQSLYSQNRGKLVRTINDLSETVAYLNHAARMIDENPSILIGGTKPDNPPDDKLDD